MNETLEELVIRLEDHLERLESISFLGPKHPAVLDLKDLIEFAKRVQRKKGGKTSRKPHWLTEEEMSLCRFSFSKVPIAQDQVSAGWYFFNELWSDAFGPFDTEEEAEKMFSKYASSMGL